MDETFVFLRTVGLFFFGALGIVGVLYLRSVKGSCLRYLSGSLLKLFIVPATLVCFINPMFGKPLGGYDAITLFFCMYWWSVILHNDDDDFFKSNWKRFRVWWNSTPTFVIPTPYPTSS